MDWPRKAFLPSNKPFLHNSCALLRIAERERSKAFAICMADWVGHSLMSVLISSSVQGLTSLLVSPHFRLSRRLNLVPWRRGYRARRTIHYAEWPGLFLLACSAQPN